MLADSLRNQFLIAMPRLADSNFEKSVSLLCEHGDDGAMGLVINRPTDLSLASMLEHLDIDCSGLSVHNQAREIYWGGPVQVDRGFVLHTPAGNWDSTIHITDLLAVTTSRDILASIAAGNGPEKFQVMLGYAGWAAGQLETEIMDNSWLNADVNNAIVFDTANDERWAAATRLLGIDPSHLAGDAGHA